MKGVSDKDAHNDKDIKGDKNLVKKPIQVLHISKKDTNSFKADTSKDNQSPVKEKSVEIKPIKSQSIAAPLKEENKNEEYYKIYQFDKKE